MSEDNNSARNGHDDSEDRFDEDGFQRFGQNEWSAGSRPKYEPTSHPEDAPGGFRPYEGPVDGQAGSQGQSQWKNQDPYQGYSQGSAPNYGTSPYPQGSQGPQGNGAAGYQSFGGAAGFEGAGQGPLEKGSGRVDLTRAVKFGFRTVFSNPTIWLLGTIALGLFFILLSGIAGFIAYSLDPTGAAANNLFSTPNIVTNVIMFVVSTAVTIAVLAGALVSVDGRKTVLGDFFKPKNVAQTVTLIFVLGVFSPVVGGLTSNVMAEAIKVDETLSTIDVNNSSLGLVLFGLLAMVLISPLYSFWTFYTADGTHSAASAVSHGLKDAARNYPKLLLFQVLGGFVMIVIGALTILLGFIVLAPAYFLTSAHLYRQMSGGMIPAAPRN
ncbi:hypothetical protein [Corynebacterium callunae]|uniref:hypothetical protein n=1 Tax=Corynebacterium callunae TaxID=1721 RepID=UPI001FFFD829|nr:hypothetical protein [Corynebacterium callunae]MCK2200364.1 hypothetical protein [Corynebacterium callunae]